MALYNFSANYVWKTEHKLGTGATSIVYKGCNSSTGEPVAIKTFSFEVPDIFIKRELETMQKINHENIVRLLAVEQSLTNRRTVMIMEYCTEGDLFSILQKPEYCYGFCGIEFCRVLNHLVAGMKYLRENHIVHRDLKPGNIMKTLTDKGEIVYKLIDFGCARELHDDEKFNSIAGTEVYLHPVVFEKAFLAQVPRDQRKFPANVDLWSIGVTLYHIATGRVPFRASDFEDRQKMHEIITKKPPKAISGRQHEQQGPIVYTNTLPATCQLTAGLKALVEPLLVRLFERSDPESGSFTQFFDQAEMLLSKRLVHVFYLNTCTLLEVYVNEEAKIADLRSEIEWQTGVAPAEQILFNGTSRLEQNDKSMKQLPLTSAERPLFLYHKNDTEVKMAANENVPVTAIETEKTFRSEAFVYKRRIEAFEAIEKLLKEAINNFNRKISKRLKTLKAVCNQCEQQLTSVIPAIELLKTFLPQENPTSEFSKCLLSFEEARKKSQEIIQATKTHHQQVIIKSELSAKCEVLQAFKGPVEMHATALAETYVKRLQAENLPNEDFGNYINIVISGNMEALKSLLMNDVDPAMKQIIHATSEWYKYAQTYYVQTEILAEDLHTHFPRVAEFQQNLQNLLADKGNELSKFITTIQGEIHQLFEETNELVSKFEDLE